VKNIAIAASLAKLFRGGKICPNFDARDLWTQAIANATATRLLAEKVGLGLPDEAFLAGLIHDLGIMVEIQARRPKFVEIMSRLAENPQMTLREAEQEILGATHEMFGAELCRLWKFPISFAYVTGFHHRPRELPEAHRTLTSLVHLADVITLKIGAGFTRGVESDELDPSLLQQLNLSQAQVEDVIKNVPSAMEEAKTIFSVA
jgi:HD-like signal output (HDOD) protein